MVKSRRTNKRRNKRKTFKGGKYIPSILPPYPPGGPYIPGDINGLTGGKYYKLSPDIHAFNGITENVNVVLSGGKRKQTRKRRHKKKGKKSKTKSRSKSRKYKRKSHKGGSIIPRDLLQLYRSAGNGVKSLYSQAVGENPNPSNNPNPMYQPKMIKTHRLNASTSNMEEIFNKANHKAANF